MAKEMLQTLFTEAEEDYRAMCAGFLDPFQICLPTPRCGFTKVAAKSLLENWFWYGEVCVRPRPSDEFFGIFHCFFQAQF